MPRVGRARKIPKASKRLIDFTFSLSWQTDAEQKISKREQTTPRVRNRNNSSFSEFSAEILLSRLPRRQAAQSSSSVLLTRSVRRSVYHGACIPSTTIIRIGFRRFPHFRISIPGPRLLNVGLATWFRVVSGEAVASITASDDSGASDRSVVLGFAIFAALITHGGRCGL